MRRPHARLSTNLQYVHWLLRNTHDWRGRDLKGLVFTTLIEHMKRDGVIAKSTSVTDCTLSWALNRARHILRMQGAGY